MYAYSKGGMLYVYRTPEHMMEAIKGSSHRLMMFSEYALETLDDGVMCKVIKDRSGMLNTEFRHPTKKILKIIKILIDDS